MRRCEREATALVRSAQSSGTVCIVTVASIGWVRAALSAFMPTLYTYVQSGALSVQSARDDYEERDEEYAPHHWKYWAFKDQLAPFPNDDLDLIVVGDGYPERYAARHVANEMGDAAAVKVVQFAQNPSAGRLATQLAFTNAAFEGLNLTYDSCELVLGFD